MRAKGWDKFQQQNLKVKLESWEVSSRTARRVTGSELQDISNLPKTGAYLGLKLFGTSIADINIALEVKRKQSPEEIEAGLPYQVRQNAQFFTEDEIHELPPHRSGLDTKIDSVKDEQAREKDIPFSPLYDM